MVPASSSSVSVISVSSRTTPGGLWQPGVEARRSYFFSNSFRFAVNSATLDLLITLVGTISLPSAGIQDLSPFNVLMMLLAER